MRLSLRELGKRCELTQSFLCDVERGKQGIGAESLLRVSRVIGISLDQLMSGDAGSSYAECLLDLPAGLVTFATDADIPFRHAVTMYWCARTIRDHQANARKASLDTWDWLRFYAALKDWL